MVGADLLQKYYRNTIDVIETEIEFSNKIPLPEIPGVTQLYLACNRCLNIINCSHVFFKYWFEGLYPTVECPLWFMQDYRGFFQGKFLS